MNSSEFFKSFNFLEHPIDSPKKIYDAFSDLFHIISGDMSIFEATFDSTQTSLEIIVSPEKNAFLVVGGTGDSSVNSPLFDYERKVLIANGVFALLNGLSIVGDEKDYDVDKIKITDIIKELLIDPDVYTQATNCLQQQNSCKSFIFNSLPEKIYAIISKEAGLYWLRDKIKNEALKKFMLHKEAIDLTATGADMIQMFFEAARKRQNMYIPIWDTNSPKIISVDMIDNDINLDWEYSSIFYSQDMKGYRIYKSTDQINWEVVEQISGFDFNSYTLSNLSPGTTYYFKMTAYSEYFESDFSNIAEVEVPVPGKLPPPIPSTEYKDPPDISDTGKKEPQVADPSATQPEAPLYYMTDDEYDKLFGK